jgi:hypothetical protein
VLPWGYDQSYYPLTKNDFKRGVIFCSPVQPKPVDPQLLKKSPDLVLERTLKSLLSVINKSSAAIDGTVDSLDHSLERAEKGDSRTVQIEADVILSKQNFEAAAREPCIIPLCKANLKNLPFNLYTHFKDFTMHPKPLTQ